MINELAKEIHQNAIEKGFYEKERNIGEMLALIHSEVSEALEADREDNHYNPLNRLRDSRDKLGARWSFDVVDNSDEAWSNWFRSEVKSSFADELADVVIRVLDLAEYRGINMEEHIKMKMRYNSMREKYHGKKY